jgi:tyrosine-protein phosphatase MSG5
MATLQRMSRANMHCRKRSFDLVTETSDPVARSRPRPTLQDGFRPHSLATRSSVPPSPTASVAKRRLCTIPPSPTMPIHVASSVMSTPYPSFMSVYGSNDLSMEPESDLSQKEKDPEASLGKLDINSPNSQPGHHALPFPIYHRGSITSIATTDSTSSPATNHSSPLFSDPSPSSSPESASSSNPPLSPFRHNMQTSYHARQASNDESVQHAQQIPPPPYQQRSNSPSRNVKKLSLNMNTAMHLRPATSHETSTRSSNLSAPVSPLKEPLRSARKKPTNLTIRTPGFNQMAFPRGLAGDVPPTPSGRPSFPTLQSSPSLPSLQTPTTASSSGLHLSLPSFSSGHSRPGSDSSFSSHQSAAQLPHLKEEDEPRRSFEAPERGYPEGPIQIYDCGVWLYLEPKAEEAREFDTVINVAKEIKNPFDSSSAQKDTVMSVWRSNRNSMVEPQTAMSEFSFKSAWEFQPTEKTPTTPRPTSPAKDDPEYLHVPWDHNSEILGDLWPLCCAIDERVKAGKRVLIHCQLGVSRSASLVIAYGLYKGYQGDFHSMYQQVKSRSRWVGPNMSLIYQLSDFRGNIEKGVYASGGRPAPPQWFMYSPPDSLSFKNPELSMLNQKTDTMPPQTDEMNDPSKTPKAQPLRSIKFDKQLPPVPLFPKMESAPAPAPMEASEPATKTNAAPPTPPKEQPAAKRQGVVPRPLPFRKLADYANPASIPPHRPRVGAIVPTRLHVSRPSMDLASQDVPETPSLFSPRATEFLANPFGISANAGELVTNSSRSAKPIRSIAPPVPSPGFIGFTHIRAPTMQEAPSILPAPAAALQVPVAIDPRSPHQQAQHREIMRHIDDFL